MLRFVVPVPHTLVDEADAVPAVGVPVQSGKPAT